MEVRFLSPVSYTATGEKNSNRILFMVASTAIGSNPDPERKYIAVCIPDDWYVSPCTGQQLVPSSVDYKLCEEKGVEITEECRETVYPTANCPCPCSVRSEVERNNIVVTTPNLLLFKAALARIIMYPEYVWSVPEIAECL